MASATEKLGVFIAQSTLPDLTPAVIDKAAASFLNAYGLAAQGYDEPVSSAVRSLALPCKSETLSAHIWPGGMHVSQFDAAMLNGVATHAHFQDDTCYASVTHPASLIVPSAVAAAEGENTSLLQCLLAIAVGYTALAWVGARERVARAMIQRGFRCSPSLGGIGSAAAAASLFRMDSQGAANAVSIAVSLAGGLLEPVRSGSDEWRIQNGRTCANGLLAACLARRGVKAASEALEGPCGLLAGMAGMSAAPNEWSSPPDFNMLLEVVAKPWATLGDNMAAAMAAKLIHDEGRSAAEIARITIQIWRPFVDFPGTAYKGPFDTTTQALASMSYATAAMLVHGTLDYRISSDERDNPGVARLLSLICIVPDDDGDAFNATVEVIYNDGKSVVKTAAEASQTQLFHDRPTSCQLLESRLTSFGYAPGQGLAFAERVYQEIDQQTGMTITELFEGLPASIDNNLLL